MDGNKPSALKVRQGLQEFMTQSREMSFGTEFSKEFFDVVNVDVELDNLGLAFNNYKIINLTDIHIGQWLNPEYLDGVVEYVNTLKPDMITLTGDYVSYILEGYETDLKKSFKKLKAKDGKLAVLGNHDHWLGASEMRDILKKADVKDLSNDVYTLKKRQFIIPGTNIAPFRGPKSTRYPVGKYKVKNMIQYTSRGLGTNMFWMRINCKPEITLFHLKSNEKQKIEIN